MPTHFGPFELNEQTRELTCRGERVILQPRVFDVLEYLVRHRDRMVGKEELLNKLWPDVIVTDASLQRAISLIRTALRQGGCADALQTRARLGYRFSWEEEVSGRTSVNAVKSDAVPSLLERDHSLAEINQRHRRAYAGEGQAVFIIGEAGIGKSALLAAVLAGVSVDTPVFRGYCDALFTPRAFGAILDIAAQLPGEPVTAGAGQAREQIFGKLYQRLQTLAPGAVVVLEDLHWADEATLDFVRFFSRRMGSTRCLLLVTYRDQEGAASRQLNHALGDLLSPQLTRLRLLPLSAGAVDKLAQEAGRDGRRIFSLTSGNPFLTRELLSSPADTVPETVRDSMFARLARCSALARKVCEVVALVPGRAEIDLVARVLGDVGEAVDEAVARGVVLHDHGTLTYRHELARLAVENVLAPAQSRGWHAQILAGLRERHADIARQVHHARCAGDRAAVLVLGPEAAKRAAAVGAHREAVAQYAAALAFADELSLKAQAELLEKHAYECYLTSQITAAVESSTRVLALWRELGDRWAEGRTLRFLSRQYWFLGDRAKAERFAVEAIEALATLPAGKDLAMAYSNRSQLAMLKGEAASAVEYGEKAVALARTLADVEVESHALNNIGTAKLGLGDQSAEKDLERSLQLARSKDLHEHVARAYVNLSTTSRHVRNVGAVRRYLQDGLAYCEERDLDAWTIYLRVNQARFDWERGLWDQALATAERLLKDRMITPISRIPALVVLARVRACRGDQGISSLLDEVLELALSTAEVQRIGPVAAARAEAAWLRGDIAATVKEAERGLQWAMDVKDAWLAGELLFWKSKAGVEVELPRWICAPFRLAIAGQWRKAEASFAEYEMPYEQALVLAQGDREAKEQSRAILSTFGANAVIARIFGPMKGS